MCAQGCRGVMRNLQSVLNCRDGLVRAGGWKGVKSGSRARRCRELPWVCARKGVKPGEKGVKQADCCRWRAHRRDEATGMWIGVCNLCSGIIR